jgi:hypothetical protein
MNGQKTIHRPFLTAQQPFVGMAVERLAYFLATVPLTVPLTVPFRHRSKTVE